MEIRMRLLITVAAAGVVLGLAACEKEAAAPAASTAIVDAQIAAVVNGDPIYASDVQLEAEAQGIVGKGEKLEFDSAEFNRVLDQLIDVRLLAKEAEGRGLDEEPNARHRLMAARERILGNILIENVVAERVDEAAIRKMYDAQVALYQLGEESHVRHIVTKTKEEIDKVAAELAKGADFAVVASAKSIDQATRLEGGDLGYISDEDASPELAKAIKDTAVGKVSRPFQTEMGWHVLKIDERRKQPPPSLEELRAPILRHLTTTQLGVLLKELRTEARIEKLNSPQNSTIDVDPFDVPPDERAPQPASGRAIPSFQAAAPETSPDTRTPRAAATATAPSPAPTGSGDVIIAPKPKATPAPAAPVVENKSGPVSETRAQGAAGSPSGTQQ